jgi:hypothetical protein
MSKRTPRRGAPAPRPIYVNASPDGALPPNSPDAERGALACVMLSADGHGLAEMASLLDQLKAGWFYDSRHRLILEAMQSLAADGHVVTAATILLWLRDKGREDDLRDGQGDAIAYLGNVVAPAASSVLEFAKFRDDLLDKARRRSLLQMAEKAKALAADVTLDPAQVRAAFAENLDAVAKHGSRERKLIEWVTIEEAQAYQPDPKLFLVGEDMISKGDVTVICGWPGLGKSRLATTLALAGATGRAWMGYRTRRKFRTLILQSENSLRRIKTEFEGQDPKLSEWVRISKPTSLSFHDPAFRRELMELWRAWPFDLIIIDPWTDVTKDAEAGDVGEAFDNIRASLPHGEDMPAIVIVAHVRKQGRTDKWKPKSGAELMHEVIGSQSTVGKARTVFALQPESAAANSDIVIFDCGKSNNDRPNPPTAWQRCNGEFRPVADFDFEAWRNPPDDAGGRKVITEATLAGVFAGGPLSRNEAVAALKEAGFAQPTAYKALSADGKFAGRLVVDTKGRLNWSKVEA